MILRNGRERESQSFTFCVSSYQSTKRCQIFNMTETAFQSFKSAITCFQASICLKRLKAIPVDEERKSDWELQARSYEFKIGKSQAASCSDSSLIANNRWVSENEKWVVNRVVVAYLLIETKKKLEALLMKRVFKKVVSWQGFVFW